MAQAPGKADWSLTPDAARICSTIVAILSLIVIVFCSTRRIQEVRSWKRLPLHSWYIIITYIDSGLFVISTTTIAKSYSLDYSDRICDTVMILCLVFFFSTRCIMYLFFLEKCHIIRHQSKQRMKDKLFMANFIIVLGTYATILVFLFIYRVVRFNDNHECIIGLEPKILIPAMVFDLVVNVYLTTLFIHPLRKTYSFSSNANPALRKIAIRTSIGMVLTLAATLINVITLEIYHGGERAWMCVMICNLDLLICVASLHYVTMKGKRAGQCSACNSQGLNSTNQLSKSRVPRELIKLPVRSTLAHPETLPDFTSLAPKAVITTECTSGGMPTTGAVNMTAGIEKAEHFEVRTKRAESPSDLETVSDLESQRRRSLTIEHSSWDTICD